MAAQADVKTEERLPNLMLVRGKYWYFRHQDVQIPMGKVAGEYGSDGFLARHAQLMHLFRLDYPDERNVYFIGWEGGPVKIGVAGEPEVRRTTLQTACPYTLRVEALTTGGVHTERDYHSRFSAHRLRNEWFERSPEIQAEIDRLNTIPSQTPWE
jgi:hypothetical protein